MNAKTIGIYLGVAASVSALIAVVIDNQITSEVNTRWFADQEVMNKGIELSNEYRAIYYDFLNDKMSETDYAERIKSFIPRYEKHIQEIDDRLWEQNAIMHRKDMSKELESIKTDVRLYSNEKQQYEKPYEKLTSVEIEILHLNARLLRDCIRFATEHNTVQSLLANNMTLNEEYISNIREQIGMCDADIKEMESSCNFDGLCSRSGIISYYDVRQTIG